MITRVDPRSVFGVRIREGVRETFPGSGMGDGDSTTRPRSDHFPSLAHSAHSLAPFNTLNSKNPQPCFTFIDLS